MSGIPVVVRWATLEINYPGSNPPAWAGLPVSIAPSGDYLTPDTYPPAQWINWKWNQQDTNIQNAYDMAVAAAVSNWQAPIAFTAFTGITDPGGFQGFVYDTVYNRWLACLLSSGSSTNHVSIAQSLDGGRSWQGVYTSSTSSAISAPLCIATANNAGNCVIVIIAAGSSTATAHTIQAPPGGGPTDVTTTLSGPASLACAWFYYDTPTTGNFFTYYIHQTSGTFAGYLQGADISGATWNPASTVPGNFTTGTNHIGNLLVATNPSNHTQAAVVAICGATAGTDTAYLMSLNSAGNVATDITPAFLTGQIVSGLAYGSNDGLWGVLCTNGVAGTSSLYTSPDLVTWTEVWTTANYSGAAGLQVIGNVWIFTLYTGAQTQLWMSAHVGSLGASADWHIASGYNIFVSSDGEGGLFSNGNQLLAASDSSCAVSLQVGFI